MPVDRYLEAVRGALRELDDAGANMGLARAFRAQLISDRAALLGALVELEHNVVWGAAIVRTLPPVIAGVR